MTPKKPPPKKERVMKCVIVSSLAGSKSFPGAYYSPDEKGYLRVYNDISGDEVGCFEPGWSCAELIDQDNAGDAAGSMEVMPTHASVSAADSFTIPAGEIGGQAAYFRDVRNMVG